ncbi:GNAT family N-acetyltransferase [Rhodobacter sp. TJ_12]|uniref:GNAT family N-acetyltransferase n=1 Tax=Rhodobacter sp. TJ_12 TaxID=2029399 RepID=UPI001CBE99F3|nr:GNAT family N-acetyltransferase [Rhodobacter sp. TJ_12]MBZ4023396.1 GNAT family N-acetyltransferase [Rhodobacter sp. TJ_12]
MKVAVLTGAALDAALDDVAALRIAVFRDWPYIYDGSLDYERRYLESYRNSQNAVVVGAFDGAKLVGAATGTPLEDHADDFAAPFAKTGLALGDVFYCAESVLLPAYRGQGLGHAFFEAREAHARALGHSYSAFCSVIRPDDHPRKPAGYRPLDAFWRKRGYEPMPGVVAHFRWTDLGESTQTEKALQFWGRQL